MSVILQWLSDSAIQFGLMKRTAKIVVLGLDNSGKSTLLFMLKNNRLAPLQPSLFPCTSEFTFSNIKYYSYDISGLLQPRRLWRDYYEAARDGVIFLVDSSDTDRFAEAREELHVLLSAEALSNVPFLVLGTKTDAPGAVSEDELRQQLRLVETTGKGIGFPPNGTRPVELFMCSTVQRRGYEEALQWFSQYVPYSYRADT
ncbi:hypothetical protein K443DRAFT_683557 [Laccaria amethystina LaAM-08-1]|uniref:Small COPII coat GTPase SAR1 n=1 Tax=Laccaria amethystina LaAM-08-1 TaxID=1095629 RepID=A0A0C9XEY1_9AGAR|nr:hypothetical protein K443DRAFT_683557 [Laccaria amethystina LaAM-08-1]